MHDHDHHHHHHKYTNFVLFLVLETVLILLFAFCTEYAPSLSVSANQSSQDELHLYYPMFQDIHIMIFLGFGFLMVFLKSHSWTSVSLNFLVATLSVQFSILTVGFWHQVFADGDWHKIQLDIKYLVLGDFGAGAVLISFGVLLGKVNARQMITIAFIEAVFYGLAEALCVSQYKAVDMGGSIYVHTFGAYFGIAASWVITDMKMVKRHEKLCAGNYNSQLMAMIGTIFLWCYWPSFNGVFAEGNSQMRVVVNTTLALSASCIMAFATSSLYCNGKFEMEDVLNATLAGGVVVGSTSDMMKYPWAVLILGAMGGFISVVGFHSLTKKMPFHDTCGVHNLHGMPGVLGGLMGGVLAWTLDSDGIDSIFGAVEDGRSTTKQGWMQVASVGTVLALALVGGAFAGLVGKALGGPKVYFHDFGNFHEIPAPKGYDLEVEMEEGAGLHDHGDGHGHGGHD